MGTEQNASEDHTLFVFSLSDEFNKNRAGLKTTQITLYYIGSSSVCL
jgi:hypothetical protein